MRCPWATEANDPNTMQTYQPWNDLSSRSLVPHCEADSRPLKSHTPGDTGTDSYPPPPHHHRVRFLLQ